MVYVSGPMRGKPRFNFPAFFAEELRLRDKGVEDIYSPARVDMEQDHFDPDNPVSEPKPQEHYVERDVDAIMASETIGRLKGWRKSTGATAEDAVGTWLSRVKYDAPDPTPELLARAEIEMQKIREGWDE